MSSSLILYELKNGADQVMSPFAWRTRLALLKLEIPFASKPLRFGEIAAIEDGSYTTVPVLNHGGTIVQDSWKIADNLV